MTKEEELDELVHFVEDYRHRIFDHTGYDEADKFANLPPVIKSLIKQGLLAWRKDMPANEHYNSSYNVQLTPKGVVYVEKIV